MGKSIRRLIFQILILAFLTTAIVGSLYDYVIRNRQIVMESTYQTLADAADDQIRLLKTELEDQFIHLEIMADYAGMHSAALDDGLRSFMETTIEKYGYYDMGLIDASTGKAQLLAGGTFDATGRDYYTKAIAGQRVIEYVERGRYSGVTVFTLLVPVYENDMVTAVLFATFDPSGFADLLEASAYGGQSYSYVTDGDGNIIIYANDPSALVSEGNVLDFFADAQLSDGITVSDIADNMNDKEALTFSFSSDGETRYATSTLIGINDWSIIYVTPAATVENRTEQSLDLMVDLVLKMSAISVILLVLLAIEERRSRREISNNEEEYRVAASHSDRIIMRYDLQAKTVSYATGHIPANPVKRTLTTGVPESTVEAGLVAEESIDAYLAFYEAMRRGERKGTQVVRMKVTSDEFAWFRGDYTLLGDGKAPRYAIISFCDVTRERERELVYEKWRHSLEDKSVESFTLLRLSISREIRVIRHDGELLNIKTGTSDFNIQLEQYISRYVMENDAKNLSAFLSLEHLVSSYYKNDRMLVLDYREKVGDDACRWVRLTVETVACDDSMEIGAYLLFEDITDTKLSELNLLHRAETDPLTGLLNRAAFEQRVDTLIRESDASTLHALLMLDIDNFKQINDMYGHDAGDLALMDIANTLCSITRAGDLMSRLGGDEFMVFLRDISDSDAAITKARQLRALAGKSTSEVKQVTVSIGIAFAPRDGSDFVTLYKKADSALYHVKGSTKDGQAIFSDNMSIQ